MSKLIFYYGSMSSAKTLNLLATAYNFEEKGIPFLCMKPSIDTRDVGVIRSRIGIERKCMSISDNTNIYELIDSYKDFLKINRNYALKWILIDEAQFLTKKQVDELALLADNHGFNIACYGLRTDFKSELFEGSKRLMELADEITEIKSSCKCGKKASINARFDKDGNLIQEGERIAIEGDTIYKPICRKCYFDLLNKGK